MEKEGFSWWIRRIRRAQNIYDEFRIDHFRGLAGFWAVPSGAKLIDFLKSFLICLWVGIKLTYCLCLCTEAKVAMVGKWKVRFQ